MSEQTGMTGQQKEALNKLRINRVILPIVLGVAVVLYLLYRQFDLEEFRKIEWHQGSWLSASW